MQMTNRKTTDKVEEEGDDDIEEFTQSGENVEGN